MIEEKWIENVITDSIMKDLIIVEIEMNLLKGSIDIIISRIDTTMMRNTEEVHQEIEKVRLGEIDQEKENLDEIIQKKDQNVEVDQEKGHILEEVDQLREEINTENERCLKS